METLCTLLVILAVLVGLTVGSTFARRQERLRLVAAQATGDEILTQAKTQAENIRKEAELKAKDEVFQKREELTREFEQERTKLHEQERRLEKREDALEQKHQLQVKKDRVLEHGQRKLAERREQVEKRGQELEVLVKTQTQKLHEISTLNREQAEALLLERLGREMADEVAARIQKHEEALRATCEERA